MRRSFRFALILSSAAVMLAGVAGARAQSTLPELSQRLLGKTLFLRGAWGGPVLEFDAAGQPLKTYSVVPFSTDSIQIKDVQLTRKELDIEGLRVGLIFDRSGGVTQVVTRSGGKGGRIFITIPRPADGNFDSALKAILTNDIAEVPSACDGPWAIYASHHWDATGAGAASAPPKDSDPPAAMKVGGEVKPPRMLHQADPEFTEAARSLRFSGSTNISLIVDAAGLPTDIQIVRPIGLGLDEQAVAAVRTYRFEPATKDGTPVPVKLVVNVNFQTFER